MTADELREIIAWQRDAEEVYPGGEGMGKYGQAAHLHRGALLDLLREIATADPIDDQYPHRCHYCQAEFYSKDAVHEPDCPALVLEALRDAGAVT